MLKRLDDSAGRWPVMLSGGSREGVSKEGLDAVDRWIAAVPTTKPSNKKAVERRESHETAV